LCLPLQESVIIASVLDDFASFSLFAYSSLAMIQILVWASLKEAS
jgi:hypothetical protein